MGNTIIIARSLWPVLRRTAVLLEKAGYRVEEVPSWGRLLESRLSCAGLSGVLLGEHGEAREEMEIVRRFRERAGAQGVPLILVGGMNALVRAERFREAGVDLVLPAHLSPAAIVDRTRPLLHYGSLYQSVATANRELREQSLRDDLTGLPNRRHFSMDVARHVQMSRRIGHPVGCIILDVDDFQKVNEAYGRAAGDDVLRQVAKLLSSVRRPYDTVARLGGDEFAWILVDAGRDRAMQAASRIQKAVREATFLGDPSPLRLTATFGVSSLEPGEEPRGDDLVENADRALYWGKESGKDVVRYYPPGKAERHGETDPHVS